MNPRNQHGFTIIELVVVIALLGLLAAVAVPRFADLSTNARAASFDGISGGFTSAIGIAHSMWLASGGTGTVISMEGGQTVAMNTNGWPTLDAANAGQDTGAELYSVIMQGPIDTTIWTVSETAAAGAGTATFVLNGLATGNTFQYNAATGLVTYP